MKGLKGFIVAVVSIWLAAGLNMGVSQKIAILGGNPDFLLIALGTLSMFSGRSGGAILGFACGIVYGALAGANLAQYCISRTIAGFVSGWLAEMGLQPTVPMAAVSVAVVTVVSELLLMFTAPPPQIMPFLGDTIRTAIYNGVLAMPFYALVSRILEAQER